MAVVVKSTTYVLVTRIQVQYRTYQIQRRSTIRVRTGTFYIADEADESSVSTCSSLTHGAYVRWKTNALQQSHIYVVRHPTNPTGSFHGTVLVTRQKIPTYAGTSFSSLKNLRFPPSPHDNKVYLKYAHA